MYTFFATDIWVDNFHAVFKPLEQGLGLPTVPAEQKAVIPGFGVWYVFAPVGETSSTFFEILALNPDDVPTTKADRIHGYPFIPEVIDSQQPRPVKTHATEVITRDFEGTVERLRSKGLRHRLDLPDEHLSIPRLWVGFEEGDEARYLPEVDGGLRLEILPYELVAQSTDVISIKVEGDNARADADSGVTDRIPDPIHFESRDFLVADIDASVRALQDNLGWTPSREWKTGGTRHVEMGFDDPGSATLHMVSSDDLDSEVGGYLRDWGPGPFTMRFAVPDLARRKAALESAGLTVVERDATDGSERRSLWVDNTHGLGSTFELVESGD